MSTGLVIAPRSARPAPKPTKLALRISENFFQRWHLILVPIVLMTLIGVLMAQRISSEYEASATLSTASNPLVEAQEVRGTATRFLESPAETTSRVVSEQLGTDLFASAVAERAGLGDAVEAEIVTLDDLRRSLVAFPVGDSLIEIRARWGDPNTGLRLVDATIAEFSANMEETVSADAQSAVEFYDDRLEEALVDADVATEEYTAFVEALPELPRGVERPLEDQLELGRLNDRIAAAQLTIDSANSAIEQSRLSVVRAQSEAGRTLQIVDPPSSTFEPKSTLVDRAVIFGAFVMLGMIVALTILLLSTYLDRSVRSAADIEAAGAGVTVAAVPRIDALRTRKRGASTGLSSARRGIDVRRLFQRA